MNRYHFTPTRGVVMLALIASLSSLFTYCTPEPAIANMFTLEQLQTFKRYEEADARTFINSVRVDCDEQNAGNTYPALRYCADAMAKGVYLSERFDWHAHDIASRGIELHEQAAKLATDQKAKDELLAGVRILKDIY